MNDVIHPSHHLLTDPGRAVNEDIGGTTPHAAWVLDGATGVGEGGFTSGATDARWYVQQFDHFLRQHVDDHTTDLQTIIRRGIESVATEFTNIVDPAEIAPESRPSAVCAIARDRSHRIASQRPTMSRGPATGSLISDQHPSASGCRERPVRRWPLQERVPGYHTLSLRGRAVWPIATGPPIDMVRTHCAGPAVRPGSLIEEALAREQRYVDADMNRVFPGSPTAEAHERRLAAQLLDEIRGCLTLSLHSTQSDDRPFAIVKELSPAATAICPYLSVEHVVETGDCIEDALVHHMPVIEIECGRQGNKQATKNAVQFVQEFLAVTGAWPQSSVEKSTTSIYRLQDPIPKERAASCAVHVENFEAVPVGTPFASLDDTAITAEETFYPVLLSADGYETQFGYTATLTGTLG